MAKRESLPFWSIKYFDGYSFLQLVRDLSARKDPFKESDATRLKDLFSKTCLDRHLCHRREVIRSLNDTRAVFFTNDWRDR